MNQNTIHKIKHNFQRIYISLRWVILSCATGTIIGLIGTAFSLLMDMANDLRISNPKLLLFLPFAGLFIAWLYQFLLVPLPPTSSVVLPVERGLLFCPWKW